jgi:microcystin-dependent protein
MATVFIGSMMLVPYNFAPRGFAVCAGQLLPISQNTALFSLLGTQFGGNGTSNFGLPDLQGCHAIGQGQGPGLSDYVMGELSGSQNVSLITTETPTHNHSILAGKQPADVNAPKGNVLTVGSAALQIYSNVFTNMTPMNAASTSFVGGSQPHNNMMPYIGLQWIIALQGVFPQRS